MGYTGRIFGVILPIANSLAWINHQGIFHRSTRLGLFEIAFSSFYILIGWWIGSIYDKYRFQKKKMQMINEKLEYLANQDGLIGIANRRAFDQYLLQVWEKAIQFESPISLILFDIDYFKNYNDTYGHLCGDDCLKRIATTIDNSVNWPKSMVARFGGEEFAIILPETSMKDAFKIAEQIRLDVESLAIPHSQSKLKGIVTISVGVTCIVPKSNSDLNEFINGADLALYQSKRNGRNLVFSYNSDRLYINTKTSSDL